MKQARDQHTPTLHNTSAAYILPERRSGAQAPRKHKATPSNTPKSSYIFHAPLDNSRTEDLVDVRRRHRRPDDPPMYLVVTPRRQKSAASILSAVPLVYAKLDHVVDGPARQHPIRELAGHEAGLRNDSVDHHFPLSAFSDAWRTGLAT